MSKSMGGMGNLVKQAQAMQKKIAKAQEEAALKEISASAGGGMVTVTANGSHQLTAIKIEPEIINANDKEMLEDLILAAANEAIKQAQDMVNEEISKITGGLNLPGLF